MPIILSIILLLLSLIPTRPVLASYQSARTDYTYQYSQYQNASDQYQVAKSAYLTYRTITAQNTAIAALRQVIQNRDRVVFTYYNLLQEKLNETPGVSNQSKNTFSGIRTNENAWLADHQKKIDAAASLDDLNAAAADFEQHYPQFDRETKQAIGTVLLTKEANLKSETDKTIASISAVVSVIRLDGQDTSFWDRGLITVKNKLGLQNTKFNQAQAIFAPADQSSAIDIYQGEQQLTQANQYLRETATYIMEIIRTITG